MDTLSGRLRGLRAGGRVHPDARRPIFPWIAAVVGYAAAVLAAMHLVGAITPATILIALAASAGLWLHLDVRHRAAHWPRTCKACAAVSGGGGWNLCRHHEDLRPLAMIASALAACVPVLVVLAVAAPVLLIASPIGIVLGYAAARTRGFSVAGGVIAGALLGPLAVVLFVVQGKRG